MLEEDRIKKLCQETAYSFGLHITNFLFKGDFFIMFFNPSFTEENNFDKKICYKVRDALNDIGVELNGECNLLPNHLYEIKNMFLTFKTPIQESEDSFYRDLLKTFNCIAIIIYE